MQYYKNFQLKNHNSLHLNSIAKELWFPETHSDLLNLINQLQNSIYYVLSYGTNVLLNRTIDKVICLKYMSSGFRIDKNNYAFVDANTPSSIFINYLLSNNITGTEGLIRLPGSVGAAIYGNAGSGSYCISNYLVFVTTINKSGELHYYLRDDLDFKRRFCNLQEKNEIIINVGFKFPNSDINKQDITKALYFRKTFPKGFNAGGIFKNWHDLLPYEKEIRNLKLKNINISKLINVIINEGNATYEDIIDYIKKVKKIIPVNLHLEIKKIGFENE